MKKEVWIEEENAREPWRSITLLRGLLHQRWRLGEGGRLSLIPSEGGLYIFVEGGTSEVDGHIEEEVLRASEVILREGIGAPTR